MARARTVALVAMLAVAAGCAVGATRAGDAAQPPERAPRAWWPDAGRYVFDLAYYPRRFTLAGTQRISFANTGPVALDAVWLRTWANAFGGCERRRAQIDVLAGGTPAAQRRDCTALQVRLERPLAPGERGEIALRISVTAPPRPDRFGRVGDTAYFGNALPILAVADRDGWRLPPYTFAGESFFSLTSAWEVRLRVAGGLQVASTGTEQARAPDGTLTLTAPRARDFMQVIGPLRVTTRRD